MAAWCTIFLYAAAVLGSPIDPHRVFLRSVEFDKTSVGLCTALELDSNITSIDLMERTTALFKFSEYDERSSNVTM